MSKLQAAQQRSADGSTRVLTKKKIANYSYILTDQLGEGYSSKVFRGLNETTSTPYHASRRLPGSHQGHRYGTHQQ